MGRGLCPRQPPDLHSPWPGWDCALCPFYCSDEGGPCKELLGAAPTKAQAHHHVLAQNVHVTKDNVLEVRRQWQVPAWGWHPRVGAHSQPLLQDAESWRRLLECEVLWEGCSAVGNDCCWLMISIDIPFFWHGSYNDLVLSRKEKGISLQPAH